MGKHKPNPEITRRFLEILDRTREENEVDKDLAAKVGITPACLSQYRHGKRQPDIDVIEALSAYTKIPVKYFRQG